MENPNLYVDSFQLYDVTFQVGLKSRSKYSPWRSTPYRVKLIASGLDEVINKWPNILMANYPVEEGSGGSHYSTDPIYGDMLKFIAIELKEEKVLSYFYGKTNDNRDQ